MHVLYFHQHFSTPSGATGNRSYWMARELVAQGHMVTMVCGSYQTGSTGLTGPFKHGSRRGVVDGIDVIEFDLRYANADSFLRRTWTFLRFAARSLRTALCFDYDILFATSTPLTAGIPGIVARWVKRKRFVFEVRDLWPELPRAMKAITNPVTLRALELLEYVTYRSAHRLVALAPGITKGIVERGVDPNFIAEIPNGCDLEIFQDGNSWRPANVEASDLLAIYAGTHGQANGLEAVLDAALVLQQRGRSDIKLMFVGEGKCKPDLQRRAADLCLTNVLFYPSMGKRELSALFAGADLGLQILRNVPAFYFGTSPNKFFDYIAASLPVLTNYPGWVAELINTHKCGLVVSPDNPMTFADALESAKDGRLALRQMGENARVLAEQRFNRDMLSKRFAEWLERAMVNEATT